MDDLLAECIALKGFRQGDGGSSSNSGGGGRPQAWADHHPQPTHDVVVTALSPTSSSSSSPPTQESSPVAAATAAVTAAGATSTTPVDVPTSAVAAAAAAAAAAVSVASNLPDGEYPPETGSLRIIGENFGCVVDVVGETAADATVATVAASSASGAARGESGGVLRAVGSATPVGHQDVLIWGPVGAVGEAKDAVAALVSGNACAEVVVGTGRIKRRDRGFWVNCEVREASFGLRGEVLVVGLGGVFGNGFALLSCAVCFAENVCVSPLRRRFC